MSDLDQSGGRSTTQGGQYKRDHPDKAREYQRRDNAKRVKAKQEAWRGTCDRCGGPTSRRDVHVCHACRWEAA